MPAFRAFRDLPALRPRKGSRAPRQGGFTLVEMMVVVSLMAVLASVAVPSFNGLIADQRVRAGASVLQENLWFARSEAIKRNRNVSFTVTSLAAGWNVLLQNPDNTTTVLRAQDGVTGLQTAFSSGTSATFQYNPYGRLGGGGAALKITVTDSSGGNARCLSFDTANRPKIDKGACT